MFTISLRRVRDTVRVTEGSEALTLKVDADAMQMVRALNTARAGIKGITKDSTDEDRANVAMTFASAIFGEEQARQLAEFYRGDNACVISVCGEYFTRRLTKLIKKAQTR